MKKWTNSCLDSEFLSWQMKKMNLFGLIIVRDETSTLLSINCIKSKVLKLGIKICICIVNVKTEFFKCILQYFSLDFGKTWQTVSSQSHKSKKLFYILISCINDKHKLPFFPCMNQEKSPWTLTHTEQCSA